MRKRKLIALAVIFAVFAAVTSYGMAANTFIAEPPHLAPATVAQHRENIAAIHGIVYASETSMTIPVIAVTAGESAKDGAVMSPTADTYYIDLSEERLYIKFDPQLPANKSYVATHYSTDGKRWTPVYFEYDAVKLKYYMNIAKVLDKGGILKLITSYDPKTRAPALYTAPIPEDPLTGVLATLGVDGANIYEFPPIRARNGMEKFSLDYYTCRSLAGNANGRWIPSAGADRMEIALTIDKKAPNEAGWGTIKCPNAAKGEVWSSEHGLKVLDLENGRQAKASYLLRTKPTYDSASGDYAAGSKIKKLTVAGVAKEPQFKLDFKKEVIKAKANIFILSNHTYTIGENTYDTFSPMQNSYFSLPVASSTDAKGYIPLLLAGDKGKEVRLVQKEYSFDAEGKYVHEESLYGQTIGVRLAVDPVKRTRPPSAIQKITVAPRPLMYQKDFQPEIEKGRFTMDKKYEAYSKEKSKWGSMPRLAKESEVKLRIKPTAKYNAKTNETEGVPASLPMVIKTAMGSYDEKRPERIGTVGYKVLEFPWYDGLMTVMLTQKPGIDDAYGQSEKVALTPGDYATMTDLTLRFYLQTPAKTLEYATATQINEDSTASVIAATVTDFVFSELPLQLTFKKSVAKADAFAASETSIISAATASEIGKSGVYLVEIIIPKGTGFSSGSYSISLAPVAINTGMKKMYSWDKIVAPTVKVECTSPEYTPSLQQTSTVNLEATIPSSAVVLPAASLTDLAASTNAEAFAKILGITNRSKLPTIVATQISGNNQIGGDLTVLDTDYFTNPECDLKVLKDVATLKSAVFYDKAGNMYPFFIQRDSIPVASMTNLEITGWKNVGVTLPSPIQIRLLNAEFGSIKNNDDISSWFSGLPSTIKAVVSATASNLLSVQLVGTPTNTANSVLSVEIPSSALSSVNKNALVNGKLSVLHNENVKLKINEVQISITAADTASTGSDFTVSVNSTILRGGLRIEFAGTGFSEKQPTYTDANGDAGFTLKAPPNVGTYRLVVRIAGAISNELVVNVTVPVPPSPTPSGSPTVSESPAPSESPTPSTSN